MLSPNHLAVRGGGLTVTVELILQDSGAQQLIQAIEILLAHDETQRQCFECPYRGYQKSLTKMTVIYSQDDLEIYQTANRVA
jgi:hypothetical protein